MPSMLRCQHATSLDKPTNRPRSGAGRVRSVGGHLPHEVLGAVDVGPAAGGAGLEVADDDVPHALVVGIVAHVVQGHVREAVAARHGLQQEVVRREREVGRHRGLLPQVALRSRI